MSIFKLYQVSNDVAFTNIYQQIVFNLDLANTFCKNTKSNTQIFYQVLFSLFIIPNLKLASSMLLFLILTFNRNYEVIQDFRIGRRRVMVLLYVLDWTTSCCFWQSCRSFNTTGSRGAEILFFSLLRQCLHTAKVCYTVERFS